MYQEPFVAISHRVVEVLSDDARQVRCRAVVHRAELGALRNRAICTDDNPSHGAHLIFVMATPHDGPVGEDALRDRIGVRKIVYPHKVAFLRAEEAVRIHRGF